MSRVAAKWIAVLAAAAIVAGLTAAAPAAPREGDVRRLHAENRIADVLVDLNLTPQQRSELRAILVGIRDGQEDLQGRLISLLEQRRDAVLRGDGAAVRQAEAQLQALRDEHTTSVREALAPFVAGLTERQIQVLARLLPGLPLGGDLRGQAPGGRRHGLRPLALRPLARSEVIELEPAMPRPQVWTGAGLGQHLDLVIELLGRM